MPSALPCRRARHGFSLIEAMVSAAILGVALIGLVQMHTTSIRGTAKAEDVGRATEIARQLADRLAVQPVDQLPACGSPTVPLGEPGCRDSMGPGRSATNPKGGECTRVVREDAIEDPETGNIEVLAPDATEGYRIDTWISSHPNGGPNTAQIHVWVCWRDPNGLINEVYTSRVKIDGVW